ncbi:hypothetical protein TREMEDRAFT_67036 [Tremella mesenterica DSM 1558]|uniref:uncharacterized protein n=1 Tax=Tremella mesenterica (strain ATCC 24925 / CBS 8224 / DSM 1558 / NBRC 9311 / NRRL Y-6157 / RJB 2259-6 / UBC 559-6) TaxID=578456 RepID=UPI0003F4A5A2|nr:uncharacterized protein TREMEDRAFT_67036 [Tremella mesenterica DSM 1558]EIW72741.1 hypothetical protein TREMEDRAFT_67036 [Tremella mesenterica DSM 1558]
MSASPSPPVQPRAMTSTTSDLYAQVFGADSDDELSEEEDDQPRPPIVNDRDADEEEEEEGAGDVYVPATATTPAKIPKFKKKKKVAGEDGEEREMRRKEKKEKRREEKENRAEVEEEEEEEQPVYDEATQRRMALEARIDAIGKKPKNTRRKRKGEDVDDKASNDAKLPATAKLAMLDEVMSVLRNQTLTQAITDNQVLDAVRVWLEPIYPSGALPAVGIQKAIFEVLPKMDLDTQILKECRLGPIVLFYTKTKRVTPLINRQADNLVQMWSRPIIKRPTTLNLNPLTSTETTRQGQTELDEVTDEDEEVVRERIKVLPKRFDAKAATKENEGRRGVRIRNNTDVQYTIVPVSNLLQGSGEQRNVSRIQADNRKFNRFARQIKMAKKR